MEKRLQRMNQEQEKTIKEMLNLLGIPENSRYISELLGTNLEDDSQEKSFKDTQETLFKLTQLLNESDKYQNLDLIQALEKELEQKTQRVETTKKKISDYLKQAKEYEDKLDENDREKEELLRGFQAPSSPINKQSNDDTLQLSDLEKSSVVHMDLPAILSSKQAQIEDLKFKIKNMKTKIASIEGDIEILRPNIEDDM